MKRRLTSVCKGADVIHFLGNGPELLGFAAAEAAARLRIPFVISPALHAGQWGDSWIDLALYRKASLLLAHTKFEKAVLERMGIPANRCRVIRHGSDSSRKGDGTIFRVKHTINGPIILFLGRKTQAKGMLYLLEAFTSVRQRFPAATLVLAGPGEGKCEYNLTEGVIDLDDLDEANKENALAACDVLCVPSEGESFGMVYFEAWSYAKPVVGLDLPTLRETIGESRGGLLTERSTSAIAEALCRILEDPQEGQRMGERGFQFGRQYSWSECVRTLVSAYTESVKMETLQA